MDFKFLAVAFMVTTILLAVVTGVVFLAYVGQATANVRLTNEDQTLTSQVAQLRANASAESAEVGDLQSQVGALKSQVSALKAQAAQLEYQLSMTSSAISNPNGDWIVMTTDSQYIYAATGAGLVQKIDPTTGAVLTSVQLITGGGLDGLYSDGQFVYAATTAPSTTHVLYKMDRTLRIVDQVADPNGEGIANVIIPNPGGNVYFGDGGGFIQEYDPTLTSLLNSNQMPGASTSDVAFDGVHLWWANTVGQVLETYLSLSSVASGTIPSPNYPTRGLSVINGLVYCGDGNGAYYRLTGLANGTMKFTKVAKGWATGLLGIAPVYLNGLVYVATETTSGEISVFSYPSFQPVMNVTVPDGEGVGQGTIHYSVGHFDSECMLLNGHVFVLTRSHIYDVTLP